MIVVVARDATLPNLDLETLSFLGSDQSCSAVSVTSAFAVYQFPLTECGTMLHVSLATHLVPTLDLTALIMALQHIMKYC